MKRVVAAIFLLSPVAYAQDATQIAHFESGRFEQAAYANPASQSANELAFMARAVLAEAMCGTKQPSADFLKSPEIFARRALAIDPEHIEAKLQLAITLSLKARPMSARAAMRSGYGDEAKSLVNQVLKSDPDNAYAHAFMAVWHIEVVRRGGAIGSRMMGASVNQARKHYAKAAALSPNDASIHWQYARALAAHNPRKYRADIDAALSLALSAPIEDHLERVMAGRAANLQKKLQNTPRRDVTAWAIDML